MFEDLHKFSFTLIRVASLSSMSGGYELVSLFYTVTKCNYKSKACPEARRLLLDWEIIMERPFLNKAYESIEYIIMEVSKVVDNMGLWLVPTQVHEIELHINIKTHQG